MQVLALAGRLRRNRISVTILSIAVLAVVAWLVYHFFIYKAPTPVSNTGIGVSSTRIIDVSNSAAQAAIAKKDYQTAINNYMQAESEAVSTGNLTQAKNILQTAIKNIPGQNVPWYLYDSLAVIARDLKDNTLELSSLQKALTKAEQPNSGAPSGLTAQYQQQIKQLGS